ncbi:hypothetical protein [Nibribacter koreensis]|uniref:DUF3592 domain-containing protein n=1 Tax=Nibribacter koreensis TaxID=1084519 RepID=A0ABP8G107_9BACT
MKKRKKNRENDVKLRLLLTLVLFLAVVFHFAIEDIFLRKYGKCTKAKVSSEIRYSSSKPDTYYFKFIENGKEYTGDSNVEIHKKEMIGDKICIVYLELLPTINRSLDGYFESRFTRCNCK